MSGTRLVPEAERFPRQPGHGSGCECLMLAAAMRVDPRNIPFEFCLHVLQQHWRLVCHHGETGECPHFAAGAAGWQEVGRLDGVKAILLSNV